MRVENLEFIRRRTNDACGDVEMVFYAGMSESVVVFSSIVPSSRCTLTSLGAVSERVHYHPYLIARRDRGPHHRVISHEHNRQISIVEMKLRTL